MMKLGQKIKELRKTKGISQEILANYLGVSFQAVSKWENDSTLPDVTMIPAIAAFFGVTTDELLDFNVYEIQKNVEAIVAEHRKYWNTDKRKAEKVIRDGLKRYPGNDVLLNCLIEVLEIPEQSDEVISIAKTLIESTKCDEVKYDAYRIMANAHKAKGEVHLAKVAIEQIPEIYFTKLEVAAALLEGEDAYEAAHRQKNLSAESLIDMPIILAKHHKERGEVDKAISQLTIAQKVREAFKDDYLEEKYFWATVYDYTTAQCEEIETMLMHLKG